MQQLASGLLPAKWKLSPRPDHIPAWSSLTRAPVGGVTDGSICRDGEVLDENVGRLVEKLKSRESMTTR